MRFTDPDGMKPSDHWRLNASGKLELTKQTNDKFNVFFDDKGNKLFQTNKVATEMANETWSTKTDEWTNKMKTVFIEIANNKAVYDKMTERAAETGFDNKLISIPQMKETGEYYKKIGPAIGALEMAKQMPKFLTGHIFSDAGPNGFLQQAGKSIYTGITGTDLMKDSKALFHQALDKVSRFTENIQIEFNHGINQLKNIHP